MRARLHVPVTKPARSRAAVENFRFLSSSRACVPPHMNGLRACVSACAVHATHTCISLMSMGRKQNVRACYHAHMGKLYARVCAVIYLLFNYYYMLVPVLQHSEPSVNQRRRRRDSIFGCDAILRTRSTLLHTTTTPNRYIKL